MHKAAQYGHVEACKLLLAAGADHEARDKCGDSADVLASNSRRPTPGTWEAGRIVRYAAPAAERRARWEADSARRARMQEIAKARAAAPPPRPASAGTAARTASAAAAAGDASTAPLADSSSAPPSKAISPPTLPERAMSVGPVLKRPALGLTGLPHSASASAATTSSRLLSIGASAIQRPGSGGALALIRTDAGASTTPSHGSEPPTPSESASGRSADTPRSGVVAARTESTSSLSRGLAGETPRAAMEARQRAEAEARKQAEVKRLSDEQAKRAAELRAKESARAAAKAMAQRAAQLGKGDEPAPAGWLRVESQPCLLKAGGSARQPSPSRRSDDPMAPAVGPGGAASQPHQRQGHKRNQSAELSMVKDEDMPPTPTKTPPHAQQQGSGATAGARAAQATPPTPATPQIDSPSASTPASDAASAPGAWTTDDAYRQERLRRDAEIREQRATERWQEAPAQAVGAVRAAVGLASMAGLPFIGIADVLLQVGTLGHRPAHSPAAAALLLLLFLLDVCGFAQNFLRERMIPLVV